MTISELKRLLLVEVQNEASFSFINTRLILRTGINLNQPDGKLSPDRLATAMREIHAMGFLKELDG
jgi:hypothetical protein